MATEGLARKEARAYETALTFLQTAVVVDDEAFLGSDESVVVDATARATTQADVSDLEDLVTPEGAMPTGGALDAEQLVRSFAQLGLVCAVLRPTRDEDDLPQAQMAFERADILILDWEIFRDDGVRALGLLRRVARDRKGIGLVAIYTQHGDLSAVAREARGALEAEIGSTQAIDDLTIVAGHLTVIVVGKLGTSESVTPDATHMAESELPRRIVTAFSMRANGLLGNVALRAIAAVRKETHLFLRVFGDSLDPGFVAQRLLLERPDDATDQAVALLGAELGSILDRADLDEELDVDRIKEWISGRGVRDAAYKRVFAEPHAVDALEAVHTMVGTGERSREVSDAGLKFTKHPERAAADLFTGTDEQGTASSGQFAALMTVKTRYGSKAPRLSLGTVVRSIDDVWWVCLQPDCDSVRLGGATRFPMVPISAVTGNGAFDVAIASGDSARKFTLPNRVRDMEMMTFDPGTAGRVLAAEVQAEPGRWYFEARDIGKLEWVAELRDDSAQKIVQLFAERLARIGLDESEWVRRSRSGENVAGA